MNPGTQLGPYRVDSLIGAGGMGEVYLATDTRLDRNVAIKVLPRELSASAALRERFEREAKAISSLNHPNICALYDVGRHDGNEYLVMEYLQGETLADRIARGALPWEQVLRIGQEIATALDRAHRQGIVHRDLKPGNIMLTKAGVKLLDFGLAKLTAAPGAPPTATMLTEQKPLTEQGTILGTLQYMAPEQLDGLEADTRTDIFALGAVLYEMATGRRAFEGKTRTSLIAAIVDREPLPISQVQPLTPPAFEHVVQKCLEKDREARWQSAYDVAEDLRWIASGSSAFAASAPQQRRTSKSLLGVAASLALVLVAAAAALVTRRLTPPADREPLRFALTAPPGLTIREVAVAPDGRSVAYHASDEAEKSSLWLHRFRDDEPRRLADGGTSPFWSPDGKKIGFVSGGEMKVMDVDGSHSRTLAEDVDADTAVSWGTSGVILLAHREAIYRVSERGGQLAPVTRKRAEDYGHDDPLFLPDGEHFLFRVVTDRPDRRGIYLGSLASGEMRRLFATTTVFAVGYAEPGYIVYSEGGNANIVARPFDLKSMQITGEPVVIVDAADTSTWREAVNVSPSGTIAYFAQRTPEVDQLVVVGRDGAELRKLCPTAPIMHIAPSPDERTFALEIYEPASATSDIWLCDAKTNALTRLTSDPRQFEWQMSWAPDGSTLYFGSNRTDNSDIYSLPATGGEPKLTFKQRLLQAPIDVSSDGRFLLAFDNSRRSPDVIAVPLGGGAPLPVGQSPQFAERTARFSPDGQWVAYDSNASGRREVYVQRFPHPSRKIRVSIEGGHHPFWRADGRELFFLTDAGEVFAAPARESGQELELGAPTLLFTADRSVTLTTFARYSIAAASNGREFYLRKRLSPRVEGAARIVVNATADLPQ